MNIRMLESRHGSWDGFVVRFFEAGAHYDLPDGLARSFLREGSAEEVFLPQPEELTT